MQQMLRATSRGGHRVRREISSPSVTTELRPGELARRSNYRSNGFRLSHRPLLAFMSLPSTIPIVATNR